MTTKTGVYLHKKGGKYKVLFCATDATNGERNGSVVVIYQSLATGEKFVREEKEFNEPGRFMLEGSA